MDELGIDRCVMYPTLASLIEERTTDDVILTHAIIHALNEWMAEHWTFNYHDRIFATPSSACPWWTKPSRNSTGASSTA